MPSPIFLRLLFAAALATLAGGARADLTSTCAPEIALYCPAVTEGRGRVSACLASYMGQISAACRTEVQAVGRGRLTPGWVRKTFDPNFRAPLPAICEAPAARYCPSKTPGGGAVFACLYSFSDRVSQVCGDAAEAALRAAR